MGEIHLSDAEWEIMNCLWNKPNQKISEIVIALSEKKAWDKHTVITLLNRMEIKENKVTKIASGFLGVVVLIALAAGGGYLYIKMKGVKPASKKNQPDPDADYHDEDEDTLQLPEDDGDEDEEVDVNEDYEAESDDEPV